MNKLLKIKIADGEYWYGGMIDDTLYMPFTKQSNLHLNLIENHAYNQVNPMLISSNGRYVYADEFFILDISNGEINIQSPAEIDYGEKENFHAAYMYLKDRYFPFCGKAPFAIRFSIGENSETLGVKGFNNTISNVTFRNCDFKMPDSSRGIIKFRNATTEDNGIYAVLFENVTFKGEKLTTLDTLNPVYEGAAPTDIEIK